MDNRSNTTLENIQKTSKSESLAALDKHGQDYLEHHRQKAMEARINKELLDTGLPVRHLKSSPNMDNEWGNCLIMIQKQLGSGILYALIGKRGTGKTQIAVELIKMVCGGKVKAKYHTAMDFFMAIKATYSDRFSVGESEVIEKFVAPYLLVIDEIHERGETDWENRLLTYMIDKRYGAMKDTILISNQTIDVFQKSIGSSILSRLQETGAIIQCDWPSFRETDLPQAG